MPSKVELGKVMDMEAGVSSLVEPKTVEDRLSVLETKVEMIFERLEEHGIVERKRPIPEPIIETNPDINKDNIPFHQNLIGVTRGETFVLTVRPDAYYVGTTPYPSLSAAAEGVSGVRRSGWTFWGLADGRSAKEAFKK